MAALIFTVTIKSLSFQLKIFDHDKVRAELGRSALVHGFLAIDVRKHVRHEKLGIEVTSAPSLIEMLTSAPYNTKFFKFYAEVGSPVSC